MQRNVHITSNSNGLTTIEAPHRIGLEQKSKISLGHFCLVNANSDQHSAAINKLNPASKRRRVESHLHFLSNRKLENEIYTNSTPKAAQPHLPDSHKF